MWQVPNDVEQNNAYPHEGDIIHVTSFKDQLEERKSIVINKFTRLTKSDVPQEDRCIFEFETASEEEIKQAWAIIEDSSFWVQEKYHKFTMHCLDRMGREKIEICPAAARVHHHYGGGLLVHTAELLELCRAYLETATKRYNFVNKDVIYASAILHDIGKVETYKFNDFGVAQQTTVERTIGHIFCGMYLIRSVFKEGLCSEEISPGFIAEVLHCIAAHHGKREWGSIVEPQSLEAGIISRLDYLSSRNGMMEKLLLESIRSGQPLQDEFNVYGDPYFASSGMRRYVAEKQDA
jgi:3'-5' exoribonuclease